MDIIKTVDQDDWRGEFFYSKDPTPGNVSWADDYKSYFQEVGMPASLHYYATFLFKRESTCFALSYGKSHFYLRRYCDFDFGIELAKRIADENDIKQTAAKRFQGKKKKDIKSFATNTRLDIESGESVDYLQAAIIEDYKKTFGGAGKFGSSALLSPDISPANIGPLLTKLEKIMNQDARFKLPRTTILTDETEVAHYDDILVRELQTPLGTSDFAHNSYDLYGVDFVFSNEGSFVLKCWGHPELALDNLSIKDLKDYIKSNKIHKKDILRIKVLHEQDGRPRFTEDVKNTLDYIADEERVLLSNGRWMRFNQDYLEFLNEYISGITVEDTEEQFVYINSTEPNFNSSDAVKNAGYEVADKNFSILKTTAKTPIEAWDLRKENCVYAVKFGTAQKLGPICDQAINVLELLRNRAGVQQIPKFDRYCLWLGYKGKKPLESIADSGSIILKQKIETWARKARELGIEPVLKISCKKA
ncbi:DUF6119 family protein [Amycolatopsis sp.]|uniref:DUF6119 family protein n=1 Tax=Amycolatopsis sp. TaxID=37632 RepID=UPI002B9B1BF1|nr:DUF6119 family protein [Amycolatopsis sp.]HVV10544.1 DUF6119 family protein [Amycolatopsis sp.]